MKTRLIPHIKRLIHTPAELASNHMQDYRNRLRDPGIKFGIPGVDKYVIPMRPGELTCIIARPGMGKTTLLARAAQLEAQNIIARGAQKKECVVYVTWETSAEELVNLFYAAQGGMSATDLAWGRVPEEDVLRRSVKWAQVPIWVIGHGVGNAGKPTPRMTPDTVFQTIEAMESEWGVHPRLLLFDYLQLMPIERARGRVEQVTEATIRMKELALRIGVPAMAGVQAKREVDFRDEKTPEMGDGQWASSIEQVADKIFGIWRPFVTDSNKPHLNIKYQGRMHQLKITPELAIFKMRKQRGDIGQFIWYLHFSPANLKLCEMELQQEHQSPAGPAWGGGDHE